MKFPAGQSSWRFATVRLIGRQSTWDRRSGRPTIRRLHAGFARAIPPHTANVACRLDLAIEAAVGSPLRVVVTAATGRRLSIESPEPLPEATNHPLTAETLIEQFGRLGKTPYELRRLEAKIDGRPMIPLSVLGKLRHEMVRLLDAAAARPSRAKQLRNRRWPRFVQSV